MQTFVPYADLEKSAQVLDMKRLGKQRVETLQLIRCNLDVTLGWKNHPAAKMWVDNIEGLIAYGVAVCNEWIARGYKDTCREKILSYGNPDQNDMPFWWGDERVHSSHRANLLRKEIESNLKNGPQKSTYNYLGLGWEENPETPYFWPTELVVSQS